MAEKLYKGRIKTELNPYAEKLNTSLELDRKLFKIDITGSLAHVKMLEKSNILSTVESQTIFDGLSRILNEYDFDTLKNENPSAEDIHSLIEFKLVKEIGEIGKKLHTARSRNDQVAFDLSLFVNIDTDELIDVLNELIGNINIQANANENTLMPGYTHLQRAQKVSFKTHLLAYKEMFENDLLKLSNIQKVNNKLVLGAAALNGSSFPIDPKITLRELQSLGVKYYEKVFTSPMFAVSDRDYIFDYIYASSLIMTHLSRLSEELILFSSQEFMFLEISDDFSTGSSIMPQKKNPDICEIIRSKTASVNSSLNACLNIFKSLPLAYNKDFQEIKYHLFGVSEIVKNCLFAMKDMILKIKINKDKMLDATKEGFLNATELANYLTKKGMEFRNAYKIVGEIVGFAFEKGLRLEEIDLDVYKAKSNLFEEDLYTIL